MQFFVNSIVLTLANMISHFSASVPLKASDMVEKPKASATSPWH
jgi:hypothetical protein